MVTIIKKVKCDHYLLYGTWTDPRKIGEERLWIIAERTRTCKRCGHVLSKLTRVPKNDNLSREIQVKAG